MEKIWILIGTAVLIPWNSFLKSFDYFGMSLRGTMMKSNFPSWITSSFTVFNVITMILSIFWRVDRVIGRRDMDKIKRTFFIVLILMMVMVILPILSMLKVDLDGHVFMTILLCITGLTGFNLAILQKSIFSFLSNLPSKNVCYFMSGQAVSGVLTSSINLFLNIGFGSVSDRQRDAISPFFEPLLYFSITTMVVLMAFIGCLYYSYSYSYNSEFESESENGLINEKHQHEELGKNKDPYNYGIGDVWDVIKIIWFYAFQAFLCLFVTLAYYASFVVSPLLSFPFLNRFNGNRFLLPIVLFLYDVGDWIGRWMVSRPYFYMHENNYLCKIMPITRLFVFAPLFYYSPLKINASHAFFNLPVYIIVVLLFGISNGYCNTIFLVHAQKLMQSKSTMNHDKNNEKCHQSEMIKSSNQSCHDRMMKQRDKICGTIMGLALSIGLTMGSLSSFLVLMLVKI